MRNLSKGAQSVTSQLRSKHSLKQLVLFLGAYRRRQDSPSLLGAFLREEAGEENPGWTWSWELSSLA